MGVESAQLTMSNIKLCLTHVRFEIFVDKFSGLEYQNFKLQTKSSIGTKNLEVLNLCIHLQSREMKSTVTWSS